jgi:LEA14-like dessication related protein
MRKRLFLFVFPLFPLLSACKSPPSTPLPAAPEQTPAAALEFERIEADSIDHLLLYYHLRAANSRPAPLEIEISGWKFCLNEFEPDAAALTLDGAAAGGARLALGANAALEKTLVLELDLQNLPNSSGVLNEHEYLANLSLDVIYRSGGAAPLAGTIHAAAAFPRIREPEFAVTSIAVLQAELINTRFKVNLRINNPNPFPVDLSSLGYELYGEGRFWADGREQDPLRVPAQGSAETELILTMNFINMNRHILNEIIAMRLVRYRFTGEAEVGTGVSWLPRFHIGFDHSGNSVVLR